MTRSEWERHSASVMAAVKATLRQYWTPKDDEIVDAVELDDWRAALEDWPVDDIRRHLRMWVSENPNKRPNHGHIAQSLKVERGRKWAESKAPETEPVRPRVTPEAASEILARAGFKPKAMPTEFGPTRELDLDALRALCETTVSQAEMAIMLGVTQQSVSKAIRKHDLRPWAARRGEAVTKEPNT